MPCLKSVLLLKMPIEFHPNNPDRRLRNQETRSQAKRNNRSATARFGKIMTGARIHGWNNSEQKDAKGLNKEFQVHCQACHNSGSYKSSVRSRKQRCFNQALQDTRPTPRAHPLRSDGVQPRCVRPFRSDRSPEIFSFIEKSTCCRCLGEARGSAAVLGSRAKEA